MGFPGIINHIKSLFTANSAGLERKPFSEINNYVYPKLRSPELFDCSDFNLLKVVQHGLVYSYINDTQKLVRPFWKFPVFIVEGILFLKRCLFFSRYNSAKKQRVNLHRRKFLTTEINRGIFDENKKYVSRFMHHIFSALGRENCFNIITLRGVSETKIDNDLIINNINSYFESKPLGLEDKSLLADLKKTFKKIKSSGRFTARELMFIDSQFHLFWLGYRIYSGIADAVKPQAAIIIPHYHREGLIAAFKKRSIPVIELQHASFMEDLLYYVYPRFIEGVAQRALFADRILVMGNFWKNYLLKGGEYSPEKISIIGNYTFSLPLREADAKAFLRKNNLDGKKILLITTQKKLTKYFIEYIHFLAPDLKNRFPEYHIIVKAHPGEDGIEQYELGHLYSNYLFVSKDTNLNMLMSVSCVHVSIYSTTLYDALGFDVVNFSLVSGTLADDFARRMIEDGIAHPIGKNENPVDKLSEIKSKEKRLKRENFFAGFDPQVLFDCVGV